MSAPSIDMQTGMGYIVKGVWRKLEQSAKGTIGFNTQYIPYCQHAADLDWLIYFRRYQKSLGEWFNVSYRLIYLVRKLKTNNIIELDN